jgi:hypothetical protein
MELARAAIRIRVASPDAVALAYRFGCEVVDADARFPAWQEADETQRLRGDLGAGAWPGERPICRWFSGVRVRGSRGCR